MVILAFSNVLTRKKNNTSQNVEEYVAYLPANIPASIVWMANHETGDLSQWKYKTPSNPSQDSGWCERPKNGVVSDIAHTGKYSMKMSIHSWFPHSGCRQFRYPEIKTGTDYYYSAWIYFPKKYTVKGWSNIMQFKAKRYDEKGGSDLFWSLRLLNRKNGAMYFQLHWDQENDYAGPTSDGVPKKGQYYEQSLVDVPPNQWIHVEIFLKQSDQFDGRIIVWQDDKEIYNLDKIRTKMPNGYNSWSVNSYGGDINPDSFIVYVDDAVVSTARIGPQYSNFIK